MHPPVLRRACLTRRHGQRTEWPPATPAAAGLALAGRAGARPNSALGGCVGRSTVLRLVDALPEPEVPAARVVGVVEYATRKGRHYGTVFVDVETRRLVDLLPGWEASSLAARLADRRGVQVVCRDRAPFFAEGATAGAPRTVQVADRWHLWHNLSDAADRRRRPAPSPPSPSGPHGPRTRSRTRGCSGRGLVRFSMAARAPIRRSVPSQACRRPCTGDGGAQPMLGLASARDDLPHRQAAR
ncbi:transposase [Streptomyces sp. NPDC049590]|uniref:transposase n=1 Tax=Streptomyces sp. NPDC049590 TaxID=3154834 RepID=UPI0034344F7E